MARFYSSLGLVLTLFAPLGLRAAEPIEVEIHKDVVYNDAKDADPVRHKLDLYLPKGQKDFPVVFFVHGGAWTMGDKNYFGNSPKMGRGFAQEGIGFITVGYRLSPAVKHPAHIEDVALAYAWAQKNIGKYGGNADQMFISGHSAGGHLVSLLVTNESYLKSHSLSPKNVRGVLPISGVYDIPGGMLPKVFGEDAEMKKMASPIRQVKGSLPPFCILFADSDFPACGKVPSELFAKALRDKGTAAETHEIKDSNHLKIIGSASDKNDDVFKMMLEFVRKHAGKK